MAPMRVNVLWIAVALLAGLVIGGWGPRLDLKKAHEDLKSLEAKQAKSAAGPTELAGLRTMLRLPEGDRRAVHRAERRETTDAASAATGVLASATTPPSADGADATNRADQRVEAREGMRKASELWMTRVALARNTFVSNVGLDKEQEKSFDVSVEAMNLRLGDRIDKWVEQLKAKGAIQPEDGIRVVNDLSGALVLTYDDLDRTMPPDWRQKAGDNFQLVNFVDPDVVTPLMDLESARTNRPWAPGQFPRHRRGLAPQ